MASQNETSGVDCASDPDYQVCSLTEGQPSFLNKQSECVVKQRGWGSRCSCVGDEDAKSLPDEKKQLKGLARF